jgi:hypothetical protein
MELFYKVRESLTCYINKALTAKTKKIAVAFKHRIRLSLSAPILKVIMESDLLVLNMDSISRFTNVSKQLSSKLKGDQTLCIISNFLILLFTVLPVGSTPVSDVFQLSKECSVFLGAPVVELSHTIPPLKFRLPVGDFLVNHDTPVHGLWHFMSVVLSKPKDYPNFWGLLDTAPEKDIEQCGDGDNQDMNDSQQPFDLGSVDTPEHSSISESMISQSSNTAGTSLVMNEAREVLYNDDDEESVGEPFDIVMDQDKREAELQVKELEMDTRENSLLEWETLMNTSLANMHKALEKQEKVLDDREGRIESDYDTCNEMRLFITKLTADLKQSEITLSVLRQQWNNKAATHSDTNHPPHPRYPEH